MVQRLYCLLKFNFAFFIFWGEIRPRHVFDKCTEICPFRFCTVNTSRNLFPLLKIQSSVQEGQTYILSYETEGELDLEVGRMTVVAFKCCRKSS